MLRRILPRSAARVGVLLALALPLLPLLTVAPAASADHAPSGLPDHHTAPASRAGHCRTGTIALTFDDGPSPTVTPHLVRVLRRLRVPATFFMVGNRVATSPETALLVQRSGFLIGNHSWAHTRMTAQSYAAVRQTLVSTRRALRRAGVRPTALMRPPYGSVNDNVLAAIESVGMTPVLWTVDSRDWAGGSSATIAASILGQLRPGRNVVLQHDGVGNSPASVAALPAVVRAARARGYCFAGLDEKGEPGFPTPDARISAGRAREGGRLPVTVHLSAPAGHATSVRLTLTSGSARVGSDLPAFTGRVTVPAGRLRATVRLPLNPDGVDEPQEQVRLRLTRARGVRLRGPDTRAATGTVLDGDPPPGLRGVDRDVEAPTATRIVRARVLLSEPSARTVYVSVTPRPGPGLAGVVDVTTTRVKVPAGARSFLVATTVRGFGAHLPTKAMRFRFDLHAPRHAVLLHDPVVRVVAPRPSAQR